MQFKCDQKGLSEAYQQDQNGSTQVLTTKKKTPPHQAPIGPFFTLSIFLPDHLHLLQDRGAGTGRGEKTVLQFRLFNTLILQFQERT